MSLDIDPLKGLDELALPMVGAPRAPLSRFYEDDHQPRREFDEGMLRDMAAEIRETGTIHTAINVRPPDPDGRMKIIHGAQRYRASVLAGVADIPYLVQSDEKVYDDYSQVSENQKRRGLEPRDLALFIRKRLDKGDSRSLIARRLGLDKAEITCHLSLLDCPDFIAILYDQGKCRTPKYIYRLALLAKSHRDAVRDFCGRSDDFSRAAIDRLAERLVDEAAGLERTPDAKSDAQQMLTGAASPTVAVANPSAALQDAEPVKASPVRPGRPAKATSAPAVRARLLALHAMHQGRQVVVLLDREPRVEGAVYVSFLADASVSEVRIDELQQYAVRFPSP